MRVELEDLEAENFDPICFLFAIVWGVNHEYKNYSTMLLYNTVTRSE